MSLKKISIVIETVDVNTGTPVTLMCFESEDEATWIKCEQDGSGELNSIGYSFYTELALLEGIIWGCAIGGSKIAEDTFRLILEPRRLTPDEYWEKLKSCIEIATVEIPLEVTIWHRSASRYNYVFLPFNNKVKLQILTTMTEGFPEDND